MQIDPPVDIGFMMRQTSEYIDQDEAGRRFVERQSSARSRDYHCAKAFRFIQTNRYMRARAAAVTSLRS